MTDQWPPPPGAPPSPPPPPGWGAPPAPAAWQPAPPATWAPAPLALTVRPGAFPLRPLGLGDVLEAAIRIIRYNAGATIGAATLIAAGAMVVPVVGSVIATWSGVGALDAESTDMGTGGLVAFAAIFGSYVVAAIAQAMGLLLCTAMTSRLTIEAGAGVRMRMGEAWAATRGKRWRVIGLALLNGLAVALAVTVYAVPFVVLALADSGVLPYVIWALVGLVLLVPLGIWLWVRLAVISLPALISEPVGVFGAIRRSWRLSSGAFWRIFGISLLTGIASSIAGSMLAMPFSIAGAVVPLVDPDLYLVATIASQALGTIVSAAVTTPFMAAVVSLLYVDQRIRKESFDVELMERAGLLGEGQGRPVAG
ncbi:MAG: glycerophosphoryl diester phosphodiesterase membrane domain-containing protein [Nocardioides sp.]|uniref:glycerophosphoryl diester phosphodiesterase membrane domain-containing protein n=1 Tax=Nocardioides sp. TaxID=35761 RepID=UPI0039E34091